MSFIRFKSNKFKDIAVLVEATELEIAALTKKPEDKHYLISVWVSFEEDIDSVIDFFDKNTTKLQELFKISEGHDPYLELFVDYYGTDEDSFQSQKISSSLLKILAELKIDLILTITRVHEEIA